MSQKPFVDHYEVLQLGQNADVETIERVYRLLAKRYHPDNGASGDEARFREVREAYEVLSDPERRARYDVAYDEQRRERWQIFEQGAALDDREEDRRIFHGVLSLLYAARRRDPDEGGLGVVHLESMLGVPREHLDFPIWYLRKRGWIEVLQTGELAITVDGIDKVTAMEQPTPGKRLMPGDQATNGVRSSREAPGESDLRASDGPAAEAAPAWRRAAGSG